MRVIQSWGSFYLPGTTATVKSGLQPMLSAMAKGAKSQFIAETQVARLQAEHAGAPWLDREIFNVRKDLLGQGRAKPKAVSAKAAQAVVDKALGDSLVQSALNSIGWKQHGNGMQTFASESALIFIPNPYHPAEQEMVSVSGGFEGAHINISEGHAAEWVKTQRQRFGLSLKAEGFELDPIELNGFDLDDPSVIPAILGEIRSTLAEYQAESAKSGTYWMDLHYYQVSSERDSQGGLKFLFRYKGGDSEDYYGTQLPILHVSLQGRTLNVTVAEESYENTETYLRAQEIATRLEARLQPFASLTPEGTLIN